MNSPSRRSPSRIYYKLSRLFDLAGRPSAGRVLPSQSMGLRRPVSTSGPPHLDFSAPFPHPSRAGERGRGCLVRQPVRRLWCRLFFATCFTRVMAPRLATLARRSLSNPFVPTGVPTLPFAATPAPSRPLHLAFSVTPGQRFSLIV